MFQANISRPVETTVISVGRVRHAHLYHDCTKIIQIRLDKKNQIRFWVIKLPDFHHLKFTFAEFLKGITLPLNTMLTSPFCFFCPSPGQKGSMRKNQQGVVQKENENLQRKIKTGLVNIHAHLSLLGNKYAFLTNPSPSLS